MNRIVNQWDVKTSANNSRVIFCYFTDCVPCKASTIWNAIVNEHAKEDKDRTFENWQKCIRFYIEKMQNIAYIGDAVNDKILRLKRPVTVSFIDHVDQIYERISYIKEGFLRCETDVPNECAIMNAIYRMGCDPIRKEYTKTHKCPDGPIDHFKSEMSALEDADKGSATHRVAMEKYAKLEKARAVQVMGDRISARNTQHGRDNNCQPYNSGQWRGRDCSRDGRDHR